MRKVKKVQGMKCRPGTIRISVGIRDNYRFKSVELEADSGSDSTCITQSTYRKLSPDLPLEKAAEISLKWYNSSEVKGLKGWFLTKIRWKDRIHLDNVFVVPDSMSNILGKNFLRPLGVQIDCGSEQVYKVLEPVTLSSIQSEFPRLFLHNLGTFPDYQHRIQLQADPTTTRLRAVPLARRKAVEKEVQNMVKRGMWEKVTRSDWVHGMVTVPKADGGVRIKLQTCPHSIPTQLPSSIPFLTSKTFYWT